MYLLNNIFYSLIVTTMCEQPPEQYAWVNVNNKKLNL
jgi:hypothetical protein